MFLLAALLCNYHRGRCLIDIGTEGNLVFAFDIPDAILRQTGPVTLSAYLNQTAVEMTTYKTAGAQRFSAMIPPELLRQSPVAIDFHLDRCVPKGVLDSRELGFVAESISLEANENR